MFITVPSGSFAENGSNESGAEEAPVKIKNAGRKQIRKAMARIPFFKRIKYYPLLEITSSFSISTTSIVFPNTLIIPSFLKSERVLITLAVLIPI